MQEIDRTILELIGLYRASTRPVIASLLPSGNHPDRPLKRLQDDQLIRANNGLPGNRCVYQITKKGAAAVGVSVARARRFGPQALHKHLGLLLFCHVEGTHRYRVEDVDLKTIFGSEIPDGSHCVAQMRDRVVILNGYVPGPWTPVSTIVRHLRAHLKLARELPAVRDYLADGRYGYAVIISEGKLRKTIMDAVRTAEPDGRGPLIKHARIWVEVVEELGLYFPQSAPTTHSKRAARPKRRAANQFPCPQKGNSHEKEPDTIREDEESARA